ncbi:putative Fe-S oxidoreductase [Halobacteroides halobius DSM 5150]|uniref:Putative Fe-S oxidoreductase n=1 Tax=Halobacteroides halobius (strain ATCC 35273 / DSM 5150 / MD-1) TaxID=748449 RepID=L0KAC9_HALHC|nr:radical SAM protein [Halobacteroides halobius]AGB41299.1 putative Fe-S oxidoreductase [Halobacteroides halobius DSM 5150]
MVAKVTILDGYLDEPSCLGVPPYIAPHVRYTYGALKEAGLKQEEINYLTVDQFRDKKDKTLQLKDSKLVIVIAGTTVPGKYLGGKPISIAEIEDLAQQLSTPEVIVSGPIINCDLELDYIDHLAYEIPGLLAYEKLTNSKPLDKYKPAQIIDNWAKLGAEVTTLHPNYPELVCEIETFRGCPRSNNCSFCSEGFKELTYHRSVDGVIKEIEALYKQGNRYFRLGAQTDLLLFQAKKKDNRLLPNPEAIKKLYSGIRKVAPDLKVLHMDNINPATIVDYPKQAEKILKTIANYNTAGDIAAFGLESADPKVLKANKIGTTADKTFKAIKMVNQITGFRERGVPKLLPGINLLHGLKGERAETMELNFKFLKRVLDAGLLLRRINIRQVNPIGKYQTAHYNKYQFKEYKKQVNHKINQPMLKKVFPSGTLLEEVIIEEIRGKISFGRQLGTYPILVGIPGQYQLGEKLDIKVIDHGFRSITGIPYPFNINQASIDQLEALPGIGKNRSTKLFMAGEIKSLDHLGQILDGYDVSQLEEIVTFS